MNRQLEQNKIKYSIYEKITGQPEEWEAWYELRNKTRLWWGLGWREGELRNMNGWLTNLMLKGCGGGWEYERFKEKEF